MEELSLEHIEFLSSLDCRGGFFLVPRTEWDEKSDVMKELVALGYKFQQAIT